MKLTKFKDDRGAVEFIESSYVFPILMIFILSISLITINYVNEFYKREILYSGGIKMLDKNRKIKKGGEFKGDFLKEDEAISKVLGGDSKSTYSYEDKFFIRKLDLINTTKKIKSLRIWLLDYPDYVRKIDIIGKAFEELSREEIAGFTLDKYRKSIGKSYIKFKEEIIK